MNRYNELNEMFSDWRQPRELGTPGSREVQLTGAGFALVIAAVVFAVGGAAAGVLMWNEAGRQEARQKRLAAEGANTNAVVTRLWRSSGKDAQRWTAYQFAYGDKIYRGTARTPRNIWSTLKEGEPIQIRFVPADPIRNFPAGWEQDQLPRWVALLVAGLLTMVSGLFIWLLGRARRLLVEGRAAPAVVVKHTRGKHGMAAQYEFRLPNGGIGKGSISPDKSPVPVGGTLCVIFDPERPGRNSRYPMDLYRIARL
jgi:hypothetical protein